MARLLTIQRTTVPFGEREHYFKRLSERKAHYAGANCRFWVFEESSLPGAFVEFIESEDAESLVKAHDTAPYPVLDPARIYHETEIP